MQIEETTALATGGTTFVYRELGPRGGTPLLGLSRSPVPLRMSRRTTCGEFCAASWATPPPIGEPDQVDMPTAARAEERGRIGGHRGERGPSGAGTPAGRSRRPCLGRLDRRRLRQRAGRELRRQLQDRADRRPRVAHPFPARARDRRRVGWFNTTRPHSALNDLSPRQFEELSNKPTETKTRTLQPN